MSEVELQFFNTLFNDIEAGFGKEYNIFCCEQAILIANTLQSIFKIDEFLKLTYEEQMNLVPQLSGEHSDNTFNMSVLLAKEYLPETRVAPSPTGFFHLGTLVIAQLNYLMARANNGKFILRIDDTDQERNKPEYIDYIYSQMNDFGLDYDVTFRQSDRLARYAEVAHKIGTKTDNGYELDMTSDTGDSYQMVILRNNGFPTYNFCSILDDYDYDVTNIIRGADHIANESKQRLIWNRICQVEGDKPFPDVTHMGLLFDGAKKLSKRSGNGTTQDYADFSKNAMLNWLLKFGWSHPNPKFDKEYPTLSMDQMVQIFNDGKVSKNNCKIDRNKLDFLNKKWKNIEKRNALV